MCENHGILACMGSRETECTPVAGVDYVSYEGDCYDGGCYDGDDDRYAYREDGWDDFSADSQSAAWGATRVVLLTRVGGHATKTLLFSNRV